MTAVTRQAPAPAAAGYDHEDTRWVDSLIDNHVGFDTSVRSDTLARDIVCYTFPRYLVIERDGQNELGTDVIVRRRTPGAACGADSVAGDFVKRNEWAEYFMGMQGDRLYLDSGTGSIRGVLIFDVSTSRKITEFTGEIAGWRDSTTLLAWIVGGDSVPRALCPRVPEGMGVSADSLVAIDLHTNSYAPLKRWRCAGRE